MSDDKKPNPAEEIIERQRFIWEGNDEARQVIDCFEVEIGLLAGGLPVKVMPELPKNTWLARLRDRLVNRSPVNIHLSRADYPKERRRDLHDIMQHATLTQVEEMIADQRSYLIDLNYTERRAEELLQDMQAIKHGTAGF